MKKLLLFYLLTIPFISIAQPAGKKAVIVTPTNDTINGFVDDKEWFVNPSVIRIKESATGVFKEYEPSQLKSVRINDGDYYESYLIQVDNTPTEFEGPLFDSSQITSVKRYAFLLVQFSNPDLTLYSYKYKTQMIFYLKKGSEIPQELIYRKYTVRKDNGIFEMEDNSYIDQLNFLAANCPKADEMLNAIHYSISDITELLQTYYNTCKKATAAYLRKQPGKGKFSASVLAGMSKTDLSFKSDNSAAVYIGVITRTPLKTKTTLAAGVSLNYNIARVHRKLSFSLDLYYNQFTASTSEYTYNSAPDNYETKMLTISATYLHSSLGLKYFLNRESLFRPFLQAGIAQSFMLSNKGEAIWDKHYFGAHTITSEYPFPDNSLKKAAFGEFIGFGLSYKKLGLSFRYHSMGSIAFLSNISSSISANTLFFSYQFTN